MSSGLRSGCAVAIVIAAAGCASSSDTETVTGPAATRCAVQAHLDTGTFPPGGGSGSVQVSTTRECSWSVQSDAPWVVLQPDPRGQGEGSVRFTIAANGDPSPRAGALSVNDQRLPVAQAGSPCAFAVSSTRESVGRDGGERSVAVETSSAQCTWTANADVPWITILRGQSGSGDGAVVFSVSGTAGPPRTGTLTVAGQTITIEQGSGCTHTTGVSSLDAGASGGIVEVPVVTQPGCAWSAVSHTPWLAIDTGRSGNGPGFVRLAIAASDGPSRSGSVTVAGVIVTVTQASGCRVSAEPGSYSAPAAGGTASFTIHTAGGCMWTTAGDTPWVSMSSVSGSGPGQVSAAFAPNDGPQRSGQIRIANQAIAVTQASRCTWALAPAVLDYDAGGGHGAVLVLVTGGCAWTAASTVTWITMQSGTSGSGEGVVQFVVAGNPGASRSASVRIGGMDLLVRQGAR